MSNPDKVDLEVETAFAVLSVIETAIQAWKQAKEGKVKPEDIIQHASNFTRAIANNDQVIDSAAKEKFQKP